MMPTKQANDLYNQLIRKMEDEVFNPTKVKPLEVDIPSHTHSFGNTYSQSMPRLEDILHNMTTDDFIVGFNYDGSFKVLKNRMPSYRRDEELDFMIWLFAKALVRKSLHEKLKLFEDTLIEEMVNAIKQTLLKEKDEK